MDTVTFTVRGTVAGHSHEAAMRYPRGCWDGVSEHDRRELEEIVRIRFGAWVRREYGVELGDEERAALTVSTA